MEKTPEPETKLDDVLKLEAIYYSAPIPRDLAVLTVLGAVFDRVYFPGVYLPKDFDRRELKKEIARIEQALGSKADRDSILGILRFTEHAMTLDGFCIFTGDREEPFKSSEDIPGKMVRDLYEAIHGPSRPNWTPHFSSWHHKAMPGNPEEHITYPGDYHYMAGALLKSAQTGIPLLNDLPGLPIPGLADASPINNAKALSALLTIECVKLVLPEMPLLRPDHLMEFRAENSKTLLVFRRSMLRYAADLNGKIANLPQDEIPKATKFFVDTEIVPALDELRAKINSPLTPWQKYAADFGSVAPQIDAAYMTPHPGTAIAGVLLKYLGKFFTETSQLHGEREALKKRSGLYYLLRLQEHQSKRQFK